MKNNHSVLFCRVIKQVCCANKHYLYQELDKYIAYINHPSYVMCCNASKHSHHDYLIYSGLTDRHELPITF